ncbi:MAG: GTP-binding protein [Myxococcota bacterium]
MVYFNPSSREITAKIVYYGPGMCGKTTNLQKVHELMRPQMKSELVSVATETDRTIYFDFLPLKLGKIAGFDFVVRTFTVPGQPYYAETRKMVLQGADGVVFVADSQRYMLDQNKDSLLDLKKNLKLNGLDYHSIPLVLQYNKVDLPDTLGKADLDQALNDRRAETFMSSAVTGQGVVETLKAITLHVFKHVRDGGLSKGGTPQRAAAPAAAPQAPQAAFAAPMASPAGGALGGLPRAPGSPMASARPAQQLGSVGTDPSQLAAQVNALAQRADVGSSPMPSREDIGMQEFQNLAVLHHKLAERVARLEQELTRLGQEHQDLKRVVGRKLM